MRRRLTTPEVKHLSRLLGWVQCHIGQDPDEMVATVRDILSRIGESNIDEDVIEQMPDFRYKAIVRRLIKHYGEKKFKTLEDLVKNYPMFSPDFMFDFKQENGTFLTSPYENEFQWIKKDDKYYFDLDTLDKIPLTMTMNLEKKESMRLL